MGGRSLVGKGTTPGATGPAVTAKSQPLKMVENLRMEVLCVRP
jgi:hypothetical protein